MPKIGEKEEKLREVLIGVSDEAIIGEALEAYREGDEEKLKKIIKGAPERVKKEIFADFYMLDFIKKMAAEEQAESQF